MGAIADAIVAYGQPLLDATDGSQEQLNKAFALIQLCYNLALLPEDRRDQSLSEVKQRFQMSDEEFDDLQSTVVEPMIRRHEEMFPLLHNRRSTTLPQSVPLQSDPLLRPRSSVAAAPAKTASVPDRYAPCPCNSGEKYKFCCGKKPR